MAVTEFAEVALFFGLQGQFPLQQLLLLTTTFCRLHWEEATTQYEYLHLSHETLSQYCFEGLYISTLLTQ